MLIKRSDLAKQFELVVQQEIKNYQDSFNLVLQSLNEIRESIKKSQKEYREKHAILQGEQVIIKIEIQNLRDIFVKVSERIERHITAQQAWNYRNNQNDFQLNEDFMQIATICKEFQPKLDTVGNEIYELKEQVDGYCRVVNDNLDDLLRRFRSEISKTKQEILEAPSQASIVKTELEEKLKSHTVDVDGIMRELRIYKHENMITQKKIEHIYTLIERLKNSEENQ